MCKQIKLHRVHTAAVALMSAVIVVSMLFCLPSQRSQNHSNTHHGAHEQNQTLSSGTKDTNRSLSLFKQRSTDRTSMIPYYFYSYFHLQYYNNSFWSFLGIRENLFHAFLYLNFFPSFIHKHSGQLLWEGFSIPWPVKRDLDWRNYLSPSRASLKTEKSRKWNEKRQF